MDTHLQNYKNTLGAIYIVRDPRKVVKHLMQIIIEITIEEATEND